jgi:predicted transcriptional regulator
MAKRKLYLPIRHLLEDNELNQLELSELTQIPQSTLNMRMNGASDWRKPEILAVCRVLHIPQSDVGALFFPEMN